MVVAVFPPQTDSLPGHRGAGAELFGLDQDAAGQLEAGETGGEARVVLYARRGTCLPPEGHRPEDEGGEALRSSVDCRAEARRTATHHDEVVGSFQGGIYFEARGAGELKVRRVLQHILSLPDGHRRLRGLRTEPLEQGFGLGVLLELDPDVGHPVSGRDLPKARSIARVARAYDSQTQAGPDHVRTPGQEGLQDDVREVGLLGDNLLQPLAGYGQHLPGLAHHGREVHRLPSEHVQLAQEATREEGSYRPRLSGEVVDNLHLALKDDYEVVGGVARPEEDVPDLRLPLLPVALEDRELVFPQLRGPRTANLSGSIDHGVSLSIAFSVASIVPLSAARRIPTIAYCYLSDAIGLRTQANFSELRHGEVRRIRLPRTSPLSHFH